MSRIFTAFDLQTGMLAQLREHPWATEVYAWNGGTFDVPSTGTAFGYVYEGPTLFAADEGSRPIRLRSGMYFTATDAFRLVGGSGIVVRALHHWGFFHLGGPVEETGRLRYIDGCTDSLLIPPVILGDPCLNLLHLPPNTQQTQHTHPSFRVGLILSGSGECVTPDDRIPLRPGMAFVIAKDGKHSFHTSNEALRVLAYHPDSDFGPTHQNHPMINRTIVGGNG